MPSFRLNIKVAFLSHITKFFAPPPPPLASVYFAPCAHRVHTCTLHVAPRKRAGDEQVRATYRLTGQEIDECDGAYFPTNTQFTLRLFSRFRCNLRRRLNNSSRTVSFLYDLGSGCPTEASANVCEERTRALQYAVRFRVSIVDGKVCTLNPGVLRKIAQKNVALLTLCTTSMPPRPCITFYFKYIFQALRSLSADFKHRASEK